MKAIVIGATGATGKELVQALLADEKIELVKILVRSAIDFSHPKLEVKVIDFEELDRYKEWIQADCAFSCLGTTLKIAGSKEAQWKIDYDYQYQFAKLCAENQVNTFILLSAQNANSKSSMFYPKMKGQLDDAVMKLNFKRLLIFRPSLLIRPNSDRMGEKLGVAVLGFLNRLGILKGHRAIAVSDLARAMKTAGLEFKEEKRFVELNEIFKLAQNKL